MNVSANASLIALQAYATTAAKQPPRVAAESVRSENVRQPAPADRIELSRDAQRRAAPPASSAAKPSEIDAERKEPTLSRSDAEERDPPRREAPFAAAAPPPPPGSRVDLTV